MRVAQWRGLGFGLAAVLALAAQPAGAEKLNGCPAGQAMQSSDPSGKTVTCIAVPPPVDVSGLQRAINNEAATRSGMDAMLLQAISDETQARKAAADDLGATMTASNIVGRYAFSGPISCINSSTGFNDDFTPKSPTAGAPGTPAVNAFVQVAIGMTTGFRTFNADGTGSAEFYTQTLMAPGAFYTAPNGAFVAFNTAPPRPSGGAGASRTAGNFTWQIEDGKLIIEEDPAGVAGFIVEGSGVGNAIAARGLPRVVGLIGKDGKLISITHEKMQVETSVTWLPDGSTRETPRICVRERLLRKL